MINVQVTRDHKSAVVTIEGIVDDKVDLKTLIGPLDEMLKVSCGGISRFNSIGIKNWIKYFEELARQGVTLVFWDCSPATVTQCNIYRNFLAGGKVISLQIPFRCGACKTHYVHSRSVAELKTVKFNIDDQPCPKCGQPGSFDDLPDAYFGFLTE